MNLKQVGVIVGIMLLLGMTFASAQGNQFQTSEKFTEQELKQYQNEFQNKYNFSCIGECTYLEENNQVKLQIRQENKFLFFNFNFEDEYTLDNNGEITKVKYNFWSRLFNRNKLGVEE